MLGLQIKGRALSPPEQEAIVFVAQVPEDRDNPIPSTSDTAPACRDEG